MKQKHAKDTRFETMLAPRVLRWQPTLVLNGQKSSTYKPTNCMLLGTTPAKYSCMGRQIHLQVKLWVIICLWLWVVMWHWNWVTRVRQNIGTANDDFLKQIKGTSYLSSCLLSDDKLIFIESEQKLKLRRNWIQFQMCRTSTMSLVRLRTSRWILYLSCRHIQMTQQWR